MILCNFQQNMEYSYKYKIVKIYLSFFFTFLRYPKIYMSPILSCINSLQFTNNIWLVPQYII